MPRLRKRVEELEREVNRLRLEVMSARADVGSLDRQLKELRTAIWPVFSAGYAGKLSEMIKWLEKQALGSGSGNAS